MKFDDNLIEELRLLNRDHTEFPKKCAKISDGIQQGNCTLLELVEQLRCFLIDTSPDGRELGMLILSQVLSSLPNDLLTADQLNFICAFYTDRLNDHHQVIPATLNGILSLISFQNLPTGSVKQLLTSLFQSVPCQQQQQQDRFNIYKILQICVKNKFSEIQEMSFDFIYGLITAMDGERDPRNLLFLFNWLPSYLKPAALAHLTEEMFEVMACYFPVDFKAPSQDPTNVTRESLAKALCGCLCATPEFAEYTLPLALEKFSSSLKIAKMDALDLLVEGCKTFEVSRYTQHSTDIWSQIQREVLHCSDGEVCDAALKSLEKLIAKLSHSADDIFKGILSDITDTLKGNLLPNMKLFEPSCKILCHVAKGSKSSASYMIANIVPLLTNTYSITKTPSHQVLLFKCLIVFIHIYVQVNDDDNISNIFELALIPNLCVKAIVQDGTELRATGLTSLSLISKSVPLETRKCFYENLCVILIIPQAPLVRTAALQCLKVFAKNYSSEVKTYILENIKVNVESLQLYLEALSVIANEETFTSIVLSTTVDYCTKDIHSTEIAAECLKNLLEANGRNSTIHSYLVEKEEAVNKLVDWVIGNLNSISIPTNTDLLKNISLICQLIIGSQEDHLQYSIISTKLPQVLNLYRSNHNPVLILIVEGLLIRLRENVKLESDLVEVILEVALKENDYAQQVSFELLANVLNKWPEGNELEKNLDLIMSCLTNIIVKNEYSNAVNLLAWITKALVMRGHPRGEEFTTKLLELLEEHKSAAAGFRIIMCDSYVSLSSTSYCKVRCLYRQKFFTEVSTKLITNYKDSNTNYLLAMGYLLEKVPTQIFILQFKKVLKLVILCLEQCQDAIVLSAVLESLHVLIRNKESLMEDYMQEFVVRFLNLSTYEFSMQVRIKALRCLRAFTDGYPVYKLLPHKQDVIQKLTRCLDDKKRLVRKEAVATRSCWILFDAPE